MNFLTVAHISQDSDMLKILAYFLTSVRRYLTTMHQKNVYIYAGIINLSRISSYQKPSCKEHILRQILKKPNQIINVSQVKEILFYDY